MPQTPQQRRANQKYAKREENKKGKPVAKYAAKKLQPLPVTKTWLSECQQTIVDGPLCFYLFLY